MRHEGLLDMQAISNGQQMTIGHSLRSAYKQLATSAGPC